MWIDVPEKQASFSVNIIDREISFAFQLGMMCEFFCIINNLHIDYSFLCYSIGYDVWVFFV